MAKKTLYFDNAASTKLDPAVKKAMMPYFDKIYANAGGLHLMAQQASAGIYEARKQVAATLGTGFRQIFFTGSATEANNMVLRGVVKKYGKGKIVVSTVEHDSVLETALDLKREGVEVDFIGVNEEGMLDLKALEKAIDKNTILVSLMYANNEIGTLFPIEKIGKMIREKRALGFPVLFHTDAVQAFQYLDCSVERLGVDFLTLSAHKIYGPKGVGALYVRDRSNLESVMTGGGQEEGLRSGTENTPYIVAMGKAMELAQKIREKESKRIRGLRDRLWQGIQKILPEAELNGSFEERLPNNLNIYFPGRGAQDLGIEFDLFGIAVSPGVACAARTAKPSHVLTALGIHDARPHQSLRFSLGKFTTAEEVRACLQIFKNRFK